MSSKTKIVVLRMKEIIYTAIFVGLAILLITLFFFMFRSKKDTPASSDSIRYIPGIYSAALTLGSQEVNIEVSVSEDQITSICMIPLSDAVETMYPLMEPSLASLTAQICQIQSLEGLTYPEESRYTSQLLIQTIGTALEKARVSN